MGGAAMVLTAAGLVFVFSVQVVHSENAWSVTYTSHQMCALKGSTVAMNCSYTYPATVGGSANIVQNKFWFVGTEVDLKENPSYIGRVYYDCNENDCTVRITDLREEDSARYNFRFITNHDKFSGKGGVALTVTVIEITIKSAGGSSTEANLECKSSCSPDGHISYVWLKNEKQVSEGNTYTHNFHPGDNLCCALKGHEHHCSPSLHAPKLPSVSVSPSAEIVEGSSVTLTCSSDANPAAAYTWYKENDENDRDPLSQTPQLVFNSIQSSESGLYSCTARSTLGEKSSHIDINVKYAPKLPFVSVSPSAEIVEGSSVNLTCSSDANPAAVYTWYKENQTLLEGSEGIYYFTSISSEDRGTYYCKSENLYGHINSSLLLISVQYAPKLPSVSVSPSAEIVEGSSVTLNCSCDANPAADYTWYKDNKEQPLGPGSIYNFASISSEDMGNYDCQCENKHGLSSSSLFINVQYAPKLPSVSVSFSGEGSSVTLTCSSDANPAATYTWYKENEDSPKASGQMFTITDAGPEHSGHYQCEVQNSRGHHNSTFHLVVVQSSLDNPGMWIIIAGVVIAVLLVVLVISITLWIWKKHTAHQQTEPTERSDKTAQKQPAEQKNGLHYASIRFFKNQADCLHSNNTSAQLQRHQEDSEENRIQYAALKFNGGSGAPSNRSQDPDTGLDPAALYSRVNNPPKKQNL